VGGSAERLESSTLARIAGALRRAWRHALRRDRRTQVLALGDSHVRVFEHWYFRFALPATRFEVVYVAGATAMGIHNPHSTTSARSIFREALATRSPDVVVLHLGEVDAAYTIWKNAEATGKNPRVLVRTAADRYWDFIREIHAQVPVIVLSACLPTLEDQGAPADAVAAVRSGVSASQRDRTRLTQIFNVHVGRRCRLFGIPFLDSGQAALGADGLVRREWTHRSGYDHHYARLPFARWLGRQLRAVLSQPLDTWPPRPAQ
jgi:hypothetical protein